MADELQHTEEQEATSTPTPTPTPSPTDAYLAVAGILIIITVVEVGVFYVPAFQAILAPLLITLSAGKFVLVVMFYMHLKKDHGLFSLIFLLPLVLAVAVLFALLFLFGTLSIN